MPLAVNRFLPADYTKIAKICERMPRNRFITSKKGNNISDTGNTYIKPCIITHPCHQIYICVYQLMLIWISMQNNNITNSHKNIPIKNICRRSTYMTP